VILFSENLAAGAGTTRATIEELQRAARAGGNPPLLVMTDQEGGLVKRLAGPPTLSPRAMTSVTVAGDQGIATGRLLRSVGVNVDLAPVADVERAPGSFLGTRSFGSDAAVVAARACAFAGGLAAEGVGYTLKHFPGLGRALGNTDVGPTVVSTPVGVLRADYGAYVTCGSAPMALVMISSAIYPGLTGPAPAVLSKATYRRELPTAIGRTGTVTISDDLQSPAIQSQTTPAKRAIGAGLDLLLYAQSEQGSAAAYSRLVLLARSGSISRARLGMAAAAIRQLKGLVAGHGIPTPASASQRGSASGYIPASTGP
jgi:beta-N-acetylhexosaminidase